VLWSKGRGEEVQVPRTRPPYPEEFKREAIELVRLTGKSIRQVARDLGISEVSLRNWVKQADRDAGKRPGGCRVTSAKSCSGCAARTRRSVWSARS
jgi:transposase-like protein